jgi:transcriptional regulator with GAF, ATPase, and Fis domain
MIKTIFSFNVQSSEFLLIVITTSFLLKLYLIKLLIRSGLKKLTITHSWLLLVGTLVGTFFGDLAWLIKLSREMELISISYTTLVFFIRISWGFLILQYQSLALFLEFLTAKKCYLNMRHKTSLLISSFISAYFFYTAFFDTALTNMITRTVALQQSLLSPDISFEIKMMNVIIYYSLFGLMIPSIINTLRKNRLIELPVIIMHQLSILLKYLIGSYLLVELLQAANFIFSCQTSYIYSVVSISTIILSCAIYYSITRVLGIRFFNSHNHVQSKPNIEIIHDFKNVLKQFCHVTNIQEISQVTQIFFKDIFDIPFRKTKCYLRTINNHDQESIISEEKKVRMIVESFLTNHTATIARLIFEEKILVYDELDFNNFYQTTDETSILLSFLKSINADIFLPIYEKKNIIAYIIIDRQPRKKNLYGHIEQDEMVIFAGYLANIINLLQHKNLPSLIQQEKELRNELYQREQEIKQYKESIQSFMHNSMNQIGIIFFKNRRFSFGNQAARELISINLNTQSGHYLTKTCYNIVHQVMQYKSAQSAITTDEKGEKLALSAVPNLEQNNIILIVHRPEINDILTKRINMLKDPSHWEYLLYLETTKAGHLINHMIPSDSEQLLNFKISLLQHALSSKPVILNLSKPDLLPMVELLHHLSHRNTLQVVSLDRPHDGHNLGIKLFGTQHDKIEQSLFKKCEQNGTLFIDNVHFLSLEIQDRLADYITYGHYSLLNSEQQIKGNIRLIFSVDTHISQLVTDNLFSKNLYHTVANNIIEMPSLQTLPERDLYDLIDGLTQQAIKSADFKMMLTLNEHERTKIIHNRPTSLQHLRTVIEQSLVKKSKKNNLYQDIHFDPAYHIIDPALAEAVRLGKHALRDEHLMELLWNKFQNQNKIAAFLGVNRSSVNRRCKQFNLQPDNYTDIQKVDTLHEHRTV